jgi:hypothetical protein
MRLRDFITNIYRTNYCINFQVIHIYLHIQDRNKSFGTYERICSSMFLNEPEVTVKVTYFIQRYTHSLSLDEFVLKQILDNTN